MAGLENFRFENALKLSEQPNGLKSLTDEELDFWAAVCRSHEVDADTDKASKARRYWNRKRRDALNEQERREADQT